MKLSKLLFILVLATSSLAFSQIEKDTLVAFQYHQKADSLFRIRKFDESTIYLKKAVAVCKKVKAWAKVANYYNCISKTQRRAYKQERALEYAKKALDICDLYLIKTHPEIANSYDNIGLYYEKKAIYNVALTNYLKALDIREKIFSKNHSDIAKSYSNICFVYFYKQNYTKAIEYNEKSLEIYQNIFEPTNTEIGILYSLLGGIYYRLEKYDKALIFYKKDLNITIKNYGEYHLNTAYSYGNIALLYDKINQLDLALKYHKKESFIIEKEKDPYALSNLYINMGVIFKEKGEKEKALLYYKKSLVLKRKLYGENHPEMAVIYANIGACYDDSDFEKKIFYYTKSLEVSEKSGNNNFRVAEVYSHLGDLYLSKKEYDSALMYYENALEIQQKIHKSGALTYLNIGDLYKEKGMYSKALNYYQKCLDIMRSLSSQDFYVFIKCYNSMGLTYYKQNKYDLSIQFYNKAMKCNTKTEYDKFSKNIFNTEYYYYLKQLFATLVLKANVLQEKYKVEKTVSNINESVILYQNLDKLVDHFRQSYQNYQDKVNLAKQAKEMYRDAIAAHFTKYKVTDNKKEIERIRYYLEKSKSNTLKNLLLENSAKNFSELPEELITLENTLKSNRAFYKSQIILEQAKDSLDAESIKKNEGKLFDVTRRQDSLTQILEKEYPKYYKLKHSNKVISVSEIQEKLDKNTTLLEFFTTDSTTYAFTISKTKFQVKELQTPKLNEKIKAFREATTSKDILAYKQLGYELYNMLIQPIKQDLVGDQLIIIPDESLWHLNFELLLTKEKTSESSSELPYLLRDYAISYANSATLLFNPFQEQKQEIKQEGCLAFSFSDSTNVVKAKNMSLAALRDTGDDLPGTRKEIRAIADIIDGQYYFGADADEANFKKNASKYKILHLALHGDVDNERPQNSKLYFTKSKDTIEDSYLYGHELFALSIPSQLTVLSACNTGTGKIAKGEGIMSLGNAFQYAGTKSLLLSSWEVPDETTPELMAYFYTNLKKGMNKAKALQQAKLQYLQQADIYKATPFYWGGFYLVGDTAPIDFGINSLWYWGIGVALPLLFGVFLYRKRNVSVSKK